MSVNKFRKRPVEIEAMQYDGRNTVEVAEWLAESGVKVGWSNAEMVIPTLEGRMHATPGDWIIRGVQDEFYPCKPDIFEATYEAPRQADREPSDAEVLEASLTFEREELANLIPLGFREQDGVRNVYDAADRILTAGFRKADREPSEDPCPEWQCPDLSSEDRREGKSCPDHPCTCTREPSDAT